VEINTDIHPRIKNSIPIAFMVFAGFLLDKLCQPVKTDEKAGEE
jgi:hypothetical protein